MDRLENYVINRLEHLEEKRNQLYAENRALKRDVEELNQKYNALVDFLKAHAEVKFSGTSDTKYVSVESLYEKYEPEDYNYLVGVIGYEE